MDNEGSETSEGKKSDHDTRPTTMSPEQEIRALFMLAWCALVSVFLIVGSVYFDKVNKDQDRNDAYVTEGMLTTAFALSLCCLCLGVGLNHATSYDKSWRNLQREKNNPVLKQKDERTGRDKCLGALFMLVPVLLIITTSSMLGNVGLNYYPTVKGITPCAADEGILTTYSDGRQCTYWGGAIPTPQPYLRACTEFSSLSCCDRNGALDAIKASNKELVKGDRFTSGSCAALLDALSCWVCSPDQALFYRDGKVRVCARMCATIMKVCGDSTYDHLERTYKDVFASGSELCEHLGFEPDLSCSCYESYPEQLWETYSSITIGPPAQTNVQA